MTQHRGARFQRVLRLVLAAAFVVLGVIRILDGGWVAGIIALAIAGYFVFTASRWARWVDWMSSRRDGPSG